MISLEELKEKIKNFQKIDLSTEEDLAIAVMNLINIEEHLGFTYMKTEKENYLNTLNEIREIRKTLLKELIQKTEGETWCISKHLLGTIYRLFEVGEKLNSERKIDKAKEVFSYAHKLFVLFWGLRLKLINLEEIKKETKEEKPWTLKEIVNKLVDCCDE